MTQNSNTNSYENPGLSYLEEVLYQMPEAYAQINGSPSYPNLHGIVRFYSSGTGVIVNAEIYGLPAGEFSPCAPFIHGFHIHEGGSCTGTSDNPFANAGMHFNPNSCQHPEHAGDLPPLFSNNGFAWMLYYTERFSISEILGRTVIIHENPDDFHSQPSENSGSMIACGVITAT